MTRDKHGTSLRNLKFSQLLRNLTSAVLFVRPNRLAELWYQFTWNDLLPWIFSCQVHTVCLKCNRLAFPLKRVPFLNSKSHFSTSHCSGDRPFAVQTLPDLRWSSHSDVNLRCHKSQISSVYIHPGESNGKLPLTTWPGCSVPEPYQSPDWTLVSAQTGPRAE